MASNRTPKKGPSTNLSRDSEISVPQSGGRSGLHAGNRAGTRFGLRSGDIPESHAGARAATGAYGGDRAASGAHGGDRAASGAHGGDRAASGAHDGDRLGAQAANSLGAQAEASPGPHFGKRPGTLSDNSAATPSGIRRHSCAPLASIAPKPCTPSALVHPRLGVSATSFPNSNEVAKTARAAIVQQKVEELSSEVMALRVVAENLETERDFYYGKCREIEIMCQELEEPVSSEVLIPKVLDILYRTAEGFAPPDQVPRTSGDEPEAN